MSHTLPIWICLSAGLSWAGQGTAAELKLDPAKLWQRSVASNVRLADDGRAIALERGVLIEDDGPAAGYTYGPNEEKLGPGIQLRKQLPVADPRADRADLLIGPGGDLAISINGQPQSLDKRENAGNYWQRYSFSPSSLRAGLNDIVVTGTGKVWIARDQDYAAGSRERTKHPNRSAKSTDGGQAWSDDKLGTGGDLDGEYYVRLFLDQFRPAGSLTLPVLDAGNLNQDAISPALSALGSLEIKLAAKLPPETKLMLSWRSGTTPLPDDKTWTAWNIAEALALKINEPTGRYFQLRVDFSTQSGLETPALQEITVRSTPKLADPWHENLRVLESRNPAIVRSSIPFTYEPLDQPKLAEFRRQHRLDEVVAGANHELDELAKLAVWSSQRWEKGHLSQIYPAWDAFEILKAHTDGQPVGGFCQQYNVVFLQACQSLGFVGRAVSIGPDSGGLVKIRGGHEVVEIWSNQFAKWIYIDGNTAWYFVDRDTRVPLGLRELRERQLQTMQGQPHRPVEIVRLAETKYEWKGLESWPPFAELRLIPRSNFLAEESPLPLNQGMRGWFWTGHHAWTDDIAPATLLYGHRVRQPGNWDWSLNQVRLHLEATPTPGELRVWLDTETPSLAKLLLKPDDQLPNDVRSEFLWRLRPGTNRLRGWARNTAGRSGAVSEIALEYTPRD
ncbi:MAG: hypothetical protein SFU86_15335 [Pirellulaceae bacterium]|nr:hypothetical protein [Pirellulaceae bacterium]